MTVKELLSTCAKELVEEMETTSFSSRDFIWKLMNNHEHEYIQVLYSDDSEHPIWNVHKQIGRYLANHKDDLDIIYGNGREVSLSPFGGDSSTQIWIKHPSNNNQ